MLPALFLSLVLASPAFADGLAHCSTVDPLVLVPAIAALWIRKGRVLARR